VFIFSLYAVHISPIVLTFISLCSCFSSIRCSVFKVNLLRRFWRKSSSFTVEYLGVLFMLQHRFKPYTMNVRCHISVNHRSLNIGYQTSCNARLRATLAICVICKRSLIVLVGDKNRFECIAKDKQQSIFSYYGC
jgi:hypothetical protein